MCLRGQWRGALEGVPFRSKAQVGWDTRRRDGQGQLEGKKEKSSQTARLGTLEDAGQPPWREKNTTYERHELSQGNDENWATTEIRIGREF